MWFKGEFKALQKNGMIIKVKGIGRPKPIERLCCGIGSSPEIISRLKKRFNMKAPDGTVGFKAVKVLE